MWCSHCQHEVPILAGLDAPREQRCPRCKRKLSVSAVAIHQQASAKENAALTLSLTGMPVDLDDWELEEDIRATKRILTLVKAGESPAVELPKWMEPESPLSERSLPEQVSAPPPVPRSPRPAPSEPAPLPPIPYYPRAANAPSPRPPVPRSEPAISSSSTSGMGWVLLSLGLMAFVCGGVLVAWSFLANRPDLWRLGLPITFAGQAALILGLVLQLDCLWQSSRRTSETLEDIDDELAEIKHATTMLGTSHSAHAQSCYAHTTSGATPQMLLADLKSQLDLLAARLSDQNRAA